MPRTKVTTNEEQNDNEALMDLANSIFEGCILLEKMSLYDEAAYDALHEMGIVDGVQGLRAPMLDLRRRIKNGTVAAPANFLNDSNGVARFAGTNDNIVAPESVSYDSVNGYSLTS